MRILVIGSGGREHALAWKLAEEAEVICAPGNAGITEDVECANVSTMDFASILGLVRGRAVDLVVVGPEDPLVMGLADALRDQGIPTFGPGRAAAQLEGSKAFSKAMMMRAGVPTAGYQTFIDGTAAKEYCRRMFGEERQVALKASGNALGKGVIVCSTLEQALEGVDQLRALGEAGRTLVIEERLIGREFSLLTLVSDDGIHSLPIAQDYKRVFDGDEGPNTGGMGSYSPLDWVEPGLVEQVEKEVVLPVVKALQEDKISYRGVLFSGLMVTSDGPKCIEYNVRFGDPETQTVLRRLGSGLAEALFACAQGAPIPAIPVLPDKAITVVLASGGYPGEYAKGKPIEIGKLDPAVKVFHAGTAKKDGQLVTNGGRVLGVSAVGATAEVARSLAYEAIGKISFDGMHFRKDIGA
ncbi:MAG: phosphoribosylamine--glycine ligase [Armatimonadetes bacterium]|nr:phosphoribosylamine--glycine ligase [Armatimonadota bacterium]